MKRSLLLYAALFLTTVVSAQCTDLFFSEYVEGSSNNKALEIFNPTSAAINLSNYRVQLYSNGSSTPGTTLTLTGTLNPGSVFVIANASANDSIKAKANVTNSVANFNGDDAIALLRGNDTLDIIGVIGEDPGTFWAVDSGSTLDKTLVRKASVQEGTKNWALSSTQWDVLPRDTIRLGFHNMDPCGAITDTLSRFLSTTATVSETSGSIDVQVVLNAASLSTTFTVDVELVGGTGDSSDINGFTNTTLTFAPGEAAKTITLTITDDTLQEPAETFIFRLRNATNGLLIGTDSTFTLTISASDFPVQFYNIAQITTTNANGEPDSLGVKVRVAATVLGINYRATGLEFFINDATGGMAVFSPTSSFGYTVTEGDSLVLEGEVGFFNGLIQLRFLDTLYKVGTGVIPTPVVVQDLEESTEAKLVRLNNVQLTTPTQWNNSNPNGFNCTISDGVTDWTLRIDEQCALYNQPAPTGKFDVIGIGSQFDNTSPYTGGYQLIPRYTTDIILISSVNNVSNAVIKMFPNPSNGSLQIYNSAEEAAIITIMNMNGQMVYTSTSTQQLHHMELTGVANGMYVVEVKTAGYTYREKLQVIR